MHNQDQPCPCICSIITFNTIPPGNKNTAPTPPPDSPLPPLSIRPLSSSTPPSRHSSPPFHLRTPPTNSPHLSPAFPHFSKLPFKLYFNLISVFTGLENCTVVNISVVVIASEFVGIKKKRLVVNGISKSWSVSSPTNPLPSTQLMTCWLASHEP